MKVLKGIALAVLSLLLLLSLVAYSWVFSMNRTSLNPDFVVARVNGLDIAGLAAEAIDNQDIGTTLTGDDKGVVLDMVAGIEGSVKAQTSVFVRDVYDYLLDKKPEPELAVTLGNTFLSPDFIGDVIDELDLKYWVERALSQQAAGDDVEGELMTAFLATVDRLEPQIKERIILVTTPVLDYLLGQNQSLDLVALLKDDVLGDDLITAVLNEVDLTSLVGTMVEEMLAESVPEEAAALTDYLERVMDDVITDGEPAIRGQMVAASEPVLDYLLGEAPGFNITFSVTPMIDSLESHLKALFVAEPPEEQAHLSPLQLGTYFDDLFLEYRGEIPVAFEMDETALGGGLGDISLVLADAETALQQARQDIQTSLDEVETGVGEAKDYIGWFRLGSWLLIALMVLLAGIIVLITRCVKPAALTLGITFLIYGILTYASVLIIKSNMNMAITEGSCPWMIMEQLNVTIPASLQPWLLEFVNDLFSPLGWWGIGFFAAGVALLIAAFVYKPATPPEEGSLAEMEESASNNEGDSAA